MVTSPPDTVESRKQTYRLTYRLPMGTEVTCDVSLDLDHQRLYDMAMRAYASKHKKAVDVSGTLVVKFVGAIRNGERVS